MGSDLEIIGGGAVAVDTVTLREMAGRFLAAGNELQDIRHRLGALQNMLLGERVLAEEAASTASVLSRRLAETLEGANRIASALREAAAIYELVELNAEHRAAVLAGDRDAVARLDVARDTLMARHPDAFAAAVGAELERDVMWPSDLQRQATELGYAVGDLFGFPAAVVGGVALGGLTLGAGALAGFSGQGTLPAGSRLTGRGQSVVLTPVTPAASSTAAPTGLRSVAQRMPGAGESRVRVERYTMPDGSRQFAVYVAGTQTLAVGGDEAWDNRSNAELYAGRASASYEATEAALAAAGARPGDVVHAFGHSQGAMVTAHLALEGGYDTRTLVSFGSPVEADVGSGTLSVAVRHTDDPVVALAGGGHIAPVGSAGSFVVEREFDPESGVHDVAVAPHRMTSYAETAGLVDASGDPRVESVQAVFADLSGAVEIEVLEYAAARGDDG
ncbi:hypothetical protein [Microbacterium sp. Root180]|uniref:hypothetical protein n=1 Tax=Microbacterium sp. Root180 TaxID=1736483 RepID=UPI00070131E2|nr:hypothetical protein [Microbacterium sp. Root180]KRB36946.1 hypothetical protein ASD93_13100 [Microbacterium sp. Root180]